MVLGLLAGCIAVANERAVGADARKPNPTNGAGDPLPLLLRETPKPNYGVAVPAAISGRVTRDLLGNTTGVEGVSVTDGYSVAKTDAKGDYTLTPKPSAVFVYITRPSGYDIVGDWYKPVAREVHFALRPAEADESDYTFVHVTDTHVSTDPISVEGLSRFVTELNTLSPRPRFVINSGDLISLSKALEGSAATAHTQIRNYVGIMNHLAMPYYNVAGDHTDSSYRLADFPRGDHRCGKPLFWEYLGPHFFSFEYGKIHFMSVDNAYHLGQRQINGREYPTLEVQPMHTAWMREDMANRTKGSFVVSASEGSLCDGCPGFGEMASQYDVRMQLTGDIHVVSQKLAGRKPRFVPYRTGGALSGCWWNPKCKTLCPDLSPQGYLIYRVRGEEMAVFYKGLGQRVAIVSHRVGAPWQGRVLVRAHVVQPRRDETLEYALDGKSWRAMKEVGRPFYRAVYEATVASTAIPDGLVKLEIRSSDTGETRSRWFVVVNRSSPTAFPTGATLAFTTAARVQKTPVAPSGKVNVLFNDQVVGELLPGGLKDYSFPIPAAVLETVNTLRFRFAEPGDGMNISNPALTVQGKPFLDPRDQAVKTVRIAHWGTDAADWGGFVVGDGDLSETPFIRRQNTFCFVLLGTD